jgi:hypothetical protein
MVLTLSLHCSSRGARHKMDYPICDRYVLQFHCSFNSDCNYIFMSMCKSMIIAFSYMCIHYCGPNSVELRAQFLQDQNKLTESGDITNISLGSWV